MKKYCVTLYATPPRAVAEIQPKPAHPGIGFAIRIFVRAEIIKNRRMRRFSNRFGLAVPGTYAKSKSAYADFADRIALFFVVPHSKPAHWRLPC